MVNEMEMITSLQNPLVKFLFKLRTNHDFRREEGAVVLEGATLIEEVCAKVTPKKILVSHPENLPKSLRSFPYLLVSEEIIKKISGTLHPEGILAEIPLPLPKKLTKLKRLLILDRVGDPGNLGTILRTALAFDWDAVFLLKGGCDPFNDKALRASKGALFYLPYQEGDWNEAKRLISQFELSPFAADIKGMPLKKLQAPKAIALVLGNEAQGISDEVLNDCKALTIPMSGKMESLNVAVAGGILMHALSGGNDYE